MVGCGSAASVLAPAAEMSFSEEKGALGLHALSVMSRRVRVRRSVFLFVIGVIIR